MRVKREVGFAVSLCNRHLAELLEKLAAVQVNIKAFSLYTSFVSNIPNVPGVCKMLVENDEEDDWFSNTNAKHDLRTNRRGDWFSNHKAESELKVLLRMALEPLKGLHSQQTLRDVA